MNSPSGDAIMLPGVPVVGHVAARLRLSFGLSLLAVFCSTCASRADELRVGSATHQGFFVGVEDGVILFRTESGTLLKEPRTSVRSLDLDEARPVSVLYNTSREVDRAMLAGYERGRFNVRLSGEETSIPGMHVRTIKVFDTPPGGNALPGADVPHAISLIDTAALRNNPDLTALQSSVLDQYEGARSRYEAFLGKSSAMVMEMDGATGNRREELLNDLRRRKLEEQPVKRDMETASSALLSAFSEILAKNVDPSVRPGIVPNEQESVREKMTLTIPRLADNEILLIDTGFLEQNGDLSEIQSTAIIRYNAAKLNYQSFAADPDATAERIDPSRLETALKEAQSGLLKAFPDLKVVTQ